MNGSCHVSFQNLPQKPAEHFGIHRAQHVQHLVVRQRLSQIKSDTLIQKAQRVSHGAVSRLRHVAHRLLLSFHALRFEKFRQPGGDGVDGDPVKVVSLAPGENGHRNFVSLCGCQDEDHIGRRLLQCFQKGVERACGKHMDLVYDIDFIISFRGAVGDLLPDLTDIVHAVIGRRVDLDNVHGRARLDGFAHLALVAGASVHRMAAVHRFGKDLGHRGLTGSPCPAEQIGVADAVRLDLIGQRSDNMVLPFHICKIIGPEFSVQGSIAHGYSPLLTSIHNSPRSFYDIRISLT